MRFPEFSGEWEKTSIGECFSKVENGLTYDTDNTSGVPVTRIETISDKSINYDRVGYANIDDKISKYEMQYGDVLFSHINSLKHIGKTAFYDAAQPLYHGMNLLLLRAKKLLDSKFLYYTLNTHKFLHRCQVLANQAVNQASINTKELKSINISVPQMQEQQKISGLISLLDERIKTQKKIIEDLKKLKDAINNSLHHNIKNYQIFSFNELGNDYSGLTGKSSDDFGYGYPYISYLNVFRNNIVTDGHFDYVKVADGERQNIVQHGDLLFTLSSETPCDVGIGAIYLGETYPLYLNSFCFGVHLTNREHIFRPYLAHFVASQYFRRTILPFAQGSTRYNLMKSDFMKHKFCFPSFERQKEIHNALHALSVKIQNEEVCLNRYSIQKQYLLTQMFI